MERPDQCGNCGSESLEQVKVKMAVALKELLDENMNPVPFAPITLPLTVLGWECEDCEALMVNEQAFIDKLRTVRTTHAAELN
jgi:hypothetical protein